VHTHGTRSQGPIPPFMSTQPNPPGEMRLYDSAGKRLYINAAERARFVAVALTAPLPQASFALTLLYTGCRISEAVELSLGSLQLETQLVTYRTLKRRKTTTYREVPIPLDLVQLLQEQRGNRRTLSDPLWLKAGTPINRSTGYRWIKAIMEVADITGPCACPKGLRHGFAIHALQSGVPLNMVQKWLGHANIETTAIYGNASGKEELVLAGRMW